jgi:dTDP-4-amino-4,6-dideoxy-D-galactose acyltransferase
MEINPNNYIIASFKMDEVQDFLPYRYHSLEDSCKRYEAWLYENQIPPDSTTLYLKENRLRTLVTKLDWDSDFFGKQIWRLQAAYWKNSARHEALAHLRTIEKDLAARGAQYVFGFIPTTCTETVDVLGRNGWSVVEARVLFYRDLHDLHDLRRYPVISATPEDIEPLAKIAAEVINPYDRFHADDYFDSQTVDLFMRTWVRNSILNNFAADTVLRPEKTPQAFLSISHRKQLYPYGIKDTQLVLSAVHPHMKGWFARLISEAAHISKEIGAKYISLTTQMNNMGAITTCQRLKMQISHTTLVLRKILQ